MNTWKMISGIASMLASAAILTSVFTSYKGIENTGDTSAKAGVICLGLAALILGLAGIVQIVFRDGLVAKARIVTVALFAVAAVLFLVTAIVAFSNVNSWIQMITYIVWTVGCAAFAYVDYVWAYDVGSDKHLLDQGAYEDSDEYEKVNRRISTASKYSDEGESAPGDEKEDESSQEEDDSSQEENENAGTPEAFDTDNTDESADENKAE